MFTQHNCEFDAAARRELNSALANLMKDAGGSSEDAIMERYRVDVACLEEHWKPDMTAEALFSAVSLDLRLNRSM